MGTHRKGHTFGRTAIILRHARTVKRQLLGKSIKFLIKPLDDLLERSTLKHEFLIGRIYAVVLRHQRERAIEFKQLRVVIGNQETGLELHVLHIGRSLLRSQGLYLLLEDVRRTNRLVHISPEVEIVGCCTPVALHRRS